VETDDARPVGKAIVGAHMCFVAHDLPGHNVLPPSGALLPERFQEVAVASGQPACPRFGSLDPFGPHLLTDVFGDEHQPTTDVVAPLRRAAIEVPQDCEALHLYDLGEVSHDPGVEVEEEQRPQVSEIRAEQLQLAPPPPPVVKERPDLHPVLLHVHVSQHNEP